MSRRWRGPRPTSVRSAASCTPPGSRRCRRRHAQIVDVDVIGTARILDEFEPYVGSGTVAVCIASMAGTMTAARRIDAAAARDDTDRRAAPLAVLDPAAMVPGIAYGVAKRANHVRVEAAAIAWGRRGGRVVSISPGIIATPMGQEELVRAVRRRHAHA